jgi:phosphotransferase system HPr (HPr) family protein
MSHLVIAEQKPAASLEAKSTVTVPCRLGLHLRVAALVVTMARKFQSDIQFCSNRLCVSAKSILGMLELSAVRGKRLSLVACGPDAQRAVQVLAELFESKEVLCKESLATEEATDGHA